MKLACIILNYNDPDRVISLVNSIKDYESIDYIIVVDNASTDDSREKLRNVPIKGYYLREEKKNLGYGAGNNAGMRFAFNELDSDAALIVNPDVAFSEALVEKLLERLSTLDHCGIVSAIQKDKDGKEIDRSAWKLPSTLEYIRSMGRLTCKRNSDFYIPAAVLHRNPWTEVGCVAGSLFMISKEAYLAAGGFDEEMFLYCEETALGFKLHNTGFKSWVNSEIPYVHLHGETINKNISSNLKRRKIMMASHNYVLEKYLHPNSSQKAVNRIIETVVLLEEVLIGLIKLDNM